MWILKRIKVKNFRAYGDDDNNEVFFEQGKIIGVVGVNGKGKTTFFSKAARYAIFGDANDVTLDELINEINEKKMVVELDMQDSETKDLFSIKRGMKPDILEATINGVTPEDFKAASMSKTEFNAKILQYLSIDKNFFEKFVDNNIVTSLNFLSAPKGEKQKIFDYIFDLANIDALKTFMKDKKKFLEIDQKKISDKLYKLKVEHDALETNIKNSEDSVNRSLESQKALVEKYKTSKDIFSKSRGEYKKAVKEDKAKAQGEPVSEESLKDAQRKLLDLRTQHGAIKAKIEFSQKRLEEFEAQQQKALDVLNNDAEYKQFKNLVPDYNALLKDINAKISGVTSEIFQTKSEVVTCESNLKVLKKRFEQFDDKCRADMADINKTCKTDCAYRNIVDIDPVKLSADIKTQEENVEGLKKILADKTNTEQELQKKKIDTETNLKIYNSYLQIQETVNKLNDDIKKLKQDLANFEAEKNAVVEKGKAQANTVKEMETLFSEQDKRGRMLNSLGSTVKLNCNSVLSVRTALAGVKKDIGFFQTQFGSQQGKLIQFKTDMTKTSEELEKINVELHQLNFILTGVMDNTRIVKYVIDSNLAIVEKLVNIYLKKFEFEHTLKMEYDSDLELIFSNKRSYKSFSEGEKLRVKTSFLFAFLIYLRSMSKSNVGFLVLDEILSSSADEDMIVKVFDCLNDIKSELTIILISHDDRMKERFDEIYAIDKGLYSSIKKIS